jgi:hypothetical protein
MCAVRVRRSPVLRVSFLRAALGSVSRARVLPACVAPLSVCNNRLSLSLFFSPLARDTGRPLYLILFATHSRRGSAIGKAARLPLTVDRPQITEIIKKSCFAWEVHHRFIIVRGVGEARSRFESNYPGVIKNSLASIMLDSLPRCTILEPLASREFLIATESNGNLACR